MVKNKEIDGKLIKYFHEDEILSELQKSNSN